MAQPPSDSPGMATGETTKEFLSACCRLVDMLDTPQLFLQVLNRFVPRALPLVTDSLADAGGLRGSSKQLRKSRIPLDRLK